MFDVKFVIFKLILINLVGRLVWLKKLLDIVICVKLFGFIIYDILVLCCNVGGLYFKFILLLLLFFIVLVLLLNFVKLV